jgi:hypothetical protein
MQHGKTCEIAQGKNLIAETAAHRKKQGTRVKPRLQAVTYSILQNQAKHEERMCSSQQKECFAGYVDTISQQKECFAGYIDTIFHQASS